MSVGFSGLHMLLPALREFSAQSDTRILLLGTQDLAFTYGQAYDFLKAHDFSLHSVPPDLRRTTDSFAYVSHKDWWQYRDFIHQETLFRMLGVDPSRVDTIDVDNYEHAKIIHDLNLPVPESLGGYHLVLNQGTLEHIFDIKQALWNLSSLTRPGGQVIHMAPAGFLNHGLYNFNACLFSDFYGQSGWQTEELHYTLTPIGHIAGQELYATVKPDRLTHVPEGFHLNVFGRFRKPAGGGATPIAVQGLYGGLHEAWKHQSRAQSANFGEPSKRSLVEGFTDICGSYLNRLRTLRRLKALGANTTFVKSPRALSRQMSWRPWEK